MITYMADLKGRWERSKTSSMRHVPHQITASLLSIRHSPDTQNEDMVQYVSLFQHSQSYLSPWGSLVRSDNCPCNLRLATEKGRRYGGKRNPIPKLSYRRIILAKANRIVPPSQMAKPSCKASQRGARPMWSCNWHHVIDRISFRRSLRSDEYGSVEDACWSPACFRLQK